MWQCVKCREKLEDAFEVCWNCGTSKDGTEDPEFRQADEVPAADLGEPIDDAAITKPAEPREQAEKNPIFCTRCDCKLDFVGTKKFHEGTRAWGFFLGDLGELFTNREHFDVFVCPRCGRVEFFVDGIGDELRSD